MALDNQDTTVEEPVITEEPVVDEVITDEPVVDEPTEDVIDEPDDEPIDEPVVTMPAKPNDHVPLTKYMAEKKKRQELEKVLSQQEAERTKFDLVRQYMERGWPESEAVNMANKDVRHDQELEALKTRFQDAEIKDLARSGDFYSDAETFTDEIKDKMKSLNISAKEAYMLLRGEARTTEIRTKQEQLNAVKRKQVVSKKVTTASSSTPSSPYKLDEHDKKALAGLQKAQPDFGWSVEKYYKLMKS